jgi:DNA-binding HxlR family transcriptional regulator
MSQLALGAADGNIDLGPLINLGGVGAVLAWFLFRAEKKFDEIRRSYELNSKALDRMVRSQMLAVMADIHVAPQVRQQAQELLQEIKEDGNGK